VTSVADTRILFIITDPLLETFARVQVNQACAT